MSRSDSASERDGVLECTDCLDPADAFALVGNETRLSILEALWAADEDPVSFSTLRRAVGVRDSAQFNYHLQQLTGHFVTRVEDVSESSEGRSPAGRSSGQRGGSTASGETGAERSSASSRTGEARETTAGSLPDPREDESSGGSSGRGSDGGYTFKHAGEKVVRSVIAGSFNEHPSIDPFPVAGSCFACAGSLQATYEDERLAITCQDCGQGHGEYAFPPGGLNDRTRGEVADAFDHRVRHLHCLAADGVCPECSGRMETHVVENGDCCLGVSVRVDHECRQCEHTLCSAAGLRLLDHSTVVSFHRERGVSLDERPYWTLPWCVSDEFTRITARDPTRLEVRIPLAGDELRVTMDAELAVLETTLETAREPTTDV